MSNKMPQCKTVITTVQHQWNYCSFVLLICHSVYFVSLWLFLWVSNESFRTFTHSLQVCPNGTGVILRLPCNEWINPFYTNALWATYEKSSPCNFDSNKLIKSWYCTYCDSSTAMTCVKTCLDDHSFLKEHFATFELELMITFWNGSLKDIQASLNKT